jgi:N-acetylglutamate synthase-like GNAT family acetyltransferase
MPRIDFHIRPLERRDAGWVNQLVIDQWGADHIVAHGQKYFVRELPGFIAEKDGAAVGLATYSISGDACELVTLNSLLLGSGLGSALIESVKSAARLAGCRRLWLVTTNDNLSALRFYQKRGFRLVRIHPGAVDESRKIKPEIPYLGEHDIPIHDEIELELFP